MKINKNKPADLSKEEPNTPSRTWLTHGKNQLSVTTLQVIAQIRAATKSNSGKE